MSRIPQKCKLLKLPPLKIRISSEHSKLTSLDTLKTNYLSTEMTNSFENNHYKIVSMKKKSCICSVPITHFNKNRRDEIRKRAQSIIDTLLEREEGKDSSFLITGMKEDYTNLIDQRLNHYVKSANDCLYYINKNQEDFNNKKIMLNQL